MGYIVIKRKMGGNQPEEFVSVSPSGRITFSKALYEKIGLLKRPTAILLLINNETGALCFDLKDKGFRDSFPVSAHMNKSGGVTCCIYCSKSIEKYNLTPGHYKVVGRDGSVYVTDCIVKL